MKTIDQIVADLAYCLDHDTYRPIETDKIELKDLSSGGDWTELYKSACAFLNAEGGIIVVGVRERDRKYLLTGYRNEPSTEEKVRQLAKQFTDTASQPIDLKEQFPGPQIVAFRDQNLLFVYVEKLPENHKYVMYKGIAYQRRLTADEKLGPELILAHQEYKEEAAQAQEIQPVPGATLADLEVDKINDYIQRLNREVKIETLKPDIEAALTFLHRKLMVRDQAPTLLGVLVAGKHPYDLIGGRCQVDAYVDVPAQTPSQLVTQAKQVLKNNIFELMEAAVGFVYRNIKVGIGLAKGGTEQPEYPEQLVREVVNNALAHRSYEASEMVHLIIRPDQSLEVRNPGRFRQSQQLAAEQPRLRRIVPLAKPANPRLADLLKTYDRWEGRGIGMATLTNYCLDNLIDVPYFILRPGSVSLFIVKGQVLDERCAYWLRSFGGFIRRQNNGYDLTPEEKILLSYFYKSEKLNREEKYTVLVTPDNNHFAVIAGLEEKGLIVRHPSVQASYPVYLVHRQLVQEDYSNELVAQFGQAYSLATNLHKATLNLIYQLEHFAEGENISARSLSPLLYLRENRDLSDFKKFDNHKRKIRLVFNQLAQQKMIVLLPGKSRSYGLNPAFRAPFS
jgi:predicted HTH transcriptional regulator